jgi:hypothetical protein
MDDSLFERRKSMTESVEAVNAETETAVVPPLPLPPMFWTRPAVSHLHAYARSRWFDAAFLTAAVLARMAAFLPPGSTMGDPAVPITPLYIAAIGPTCSGKSEAHRAARGIVPGEGDWRAGVFEEWVPFPEWLPDLRKALASDRFVFVAPSRSEFVRPEQRPACAQPLFVPPSAPITVRFPDDFGGHTIRRRLAALFAILRTSDLVDEDDWCLAGILLEHSRQVARWLAERKPAARPRSTQRKTSVRMKTSRKVS